MPSQIITTNIITDDHDVHYKTYVPPTGSFRAGTSYADLTGLGGNTSRLYKITSFYICNQEDEPVTYFLKINTTEFLYHLNGGETLNIAKTTQPIYLSTNVLQHKASAASQVTIIVQYQEFI